RGRRRRRGGRPAAAGGAPRGEGGAQRSLPLRVGGEVQEGPRGRRHLRLTAPGPPRAGGRPAGVTRGGARAGVRRGRGAGGGRGARRGCNGGPRMGGLAATGRPFLNGSGPERERTWMPQPVEVIDLSGGGLAEGAGGAEPRLALTFDDVSIVPGLAEVH